MSTMGCYVSIHSFYTDELHQPSQTQDSTGLATARLAPCPAEEQMVFPLHSTHYRDVSITRWCTYLVPSVGQLLFSLQVADKVGVLSCRQDRDWLALVAIDATRGCVRLVWCSHGRKSGSLIHSVERQQGKQHENCWSDSALTRGWNDLILSPMSIKACA